MGETKKMRKKKIIVVSVLLLGFLSGCSSMNSRFDCPNKPGITCRSLDQVSDMVDRGMIGRDVSIKSSHAPTFYPIKNTKNILPNNLSHSLRSGEQVVRVWVAPYQDVNSNYHNEGTLYVVVRKNNWAVPTEVKE